ncbi:hypothetical protein AB0H83_44540 [Dactylosporangium sp. NPDC050688]|uniref:HIT family protein n=1 Tax=Dactylosporangium sp. NPDC050688 TaxID=3157217 RepID=UPI00340D1F9A
MSEHVSERVNGCVFCQDLDTVLWRGEQFFIVPDIAPLAAGHALICSVGHYPSAADLPATAARELDDIYDRLHGAYLDRYGAFTMFEHGRTGHCLRRRPTERICHHTHIHLLPVAGDLIATLGLGQRAPWRTWSDVGDLGRDTDGYAVLETVASGRQFFPISHDLAPHYLRTRTTELIGTPHRADWEAVLSTADNTERLRDSRRALVDLVDGLTLARRGPGPSDSTALT